MWKKKDKHLTPEEAVTGDLGSQWDPLAVAPTSKLVVSMVQGARTQETCERLVEDFAARTAHVPPALVTTDEHAPYQTALRKVYGRLYRPRRRRKRGRKRRIRLAAPRELVYATVHKTRQKGRVVEVDPGWSSGIWQDSRPGSRPRRCRARSTQVSWSATMGRLGTSMDASSARRTSSPSVGKNTAL